MKLVGFYAMFSWCCFVVAVFVFKNDRKRRHPNLLLAVSLRFGQKIWSVNSKVRALVILMFGQKNLESNSKVRAVVG